jgi:hypothetical protein
MKTKTGPNPIYCKSESQAHPVVRNRYAVETEPIKEFFATICRWIDYRVSGGYIFGFSRVGKSRAVQFWLSDLLAERYNGRLPLFTLIHNGHNIVSESEFLAELLASSGHKFSKRAHREIMLDRLVKLYATRAADLRDNHIVLVVDEAQDMRDVNYRTLCNLQNALDALGFQLTVISIGTHQLAFQQEVFLLTGDIHLWARFMAEQPKFRGISSEKELTFVLEGYDTLSEWPENSGTTYTGYFFPIAFAGGFRLAKYAPQLWETFAKNAPQHLGFKLEVPMVHVARIVHSLFQDFSDDYVSKYEVTHSELSDLVKRSPYRVHLSAISKSLREDSTGPAMRRAQHVEEVPKDISK